MYVTKRRELQQLELQYRQNQGSQIYSRESSHRQSEDSTALLTTLKA